jgi:hypothetical protein
MKRVLFCCGIVLAVFRLAHAQTQSPEAMLRQILRSHGAVTLPSDFVLQGQITDRSGRRSLRMQVKGKNQIRYEQTQGTRTTVSIFNAGRAWSGPTGSLKPLWEHASVRRPMELPFLDIVNEVGDRRLKIRYVGTEVLGTRTVLHFALRYLDLTPQKRFLNRALDEEADFFADASTGLIVRSQRMQAANDSMDFRVPSVLDFSDYRPVNGLMIPFRIVNTVGTSSSGIYQSTVVVQSVLLNQGIADSVFLPQ